MKHQKSDLEDIDTIYKRNYRDSMDISHIDRSQGNLT